MLSDKKLNEGQPPQWIKVYVTPEQFRRLELASDYPQAARLEPKDCGGGSIEPFAVLNDDLTVRVVTVTFPFGPALQMTREEKKLWVAGRRAFDRALTRKEQESKRETARQEKETARYEAKQQRERERERAAKAKKGTSK